jgi:hypothetical protein
MFIIQEYVPPDIYEKYYEHSVWFINPKLMESDLTLRKYFDVPIIINNWHNGGQRKYSGFRPRNCNIGSDLSQHRLGNASDKIFKGLDVLEVQQEIIKNQDKFPLIGAIETGVNWVHTDVRTRINGSLLEFKKT